MPRTEAEIIEHWSKIGYLQGLAKLEARVQAEINELSLQLEEALKPEQNDNGNIESN